MERKLRRYRRVTLEESTQSPQQLYNLQNANLQSKREIRYPKRPCATFSILKLRGLKPNGRKFYLFITEKTVIQCINWLFKNKLVKERSIHKSTVFDGPIT